ncbi:MAG: hypothetical protein KatS3mg111_1006 [Pirellulaceae bacterium]|nr:MAG: hypothetical protein KatS3mg111_1006 [Pirellulaceae bacterium]
MSTGTPRIPKSQELPNDRGDCASVSGSQTPSFAETALRLGGKSAEEARRTGRIDSADDQVEAMFAPQYRTTASPVHRSVWQRRIPWDNFHFASMAMADDVQVAMHRAVRLVQQLKRDGRLLDDDGKISEDALQQLGATGYWGLLISQQYGGLGASMVDFSRVLTRMATVDPTVAGLASVHGCIGAVDPLRTFGSDEQKRRFLPDLASGKRLSAFALTEPGAGSDLTALRTTARRVGDHYLVTGEKLFITNARPGRTIGLVCLIEGTPSVLIVDLPEEENEHFQLRRYGLHALKHAHNNGLIFRDFPVPVDNLLLPPHGDGLTIAYHGLNLGRVALCASAAGTMRWMLADMLPWAQYRQTYGQPIERRELVQRRVAMMAGYIVACDALTWWCSNLLDRGFRGEMECIIAKVFGSEAQKTAAIEYYMKTHGGRAFLHGHFFGDNVHEFLAPCIYEGEGEMLGMAFFKSLVKHHGQRFFEPIGRVLVESGIKRPRLADPRQAWRLRKELCNYAWWWVGQRLVRAGGIDFRQVPPHLRRYVQLAGDRLTSDCFRISAAMRAHQLKLADRQCSMIHLGTGVQQAVVILVVAAYADAYREDEVVSQAAEVICGHLARQLLYRSPTHADFRRMTDLGDCIARHGWKELEGIDAGNILMKYD